MPILPSLTGPADLRGLDEVQLAQLALEIRETIIATVASTGGHLGSSLGVVELTIALHRLLESPRDKIVWDTGHQAYPHKLLTGRLEREPGHQRRVADHDGDPLMRAADVPGRGEALRDGQARARVAAVEDVVLALAPPREAADTVDLAQRPEALETAGQQLMGVRLVAGVPHDLVARRLEQAMERNRDLDHAEARAEVAAGLRDGGDDRLADLGGELLQLALAEAAQV